MTCSRAQEVQIWLLKYICFFLAAETDLHDGVADAPSLFAEHLVL